MITKKPVLVVITGPTASGKTGISIELAGKLNTEILSCDSRQFYREMKIGTAAPSEEELSSVKHHFIGHLSVKDNYNVAEFESDALGLLQKLFSVYPLVLMVGGSGLYLDAVVKGIDILPDPDPEIRAELNHILNNDGIESLRFELRKADPDYARIVDMANPARLIRALEIYRITGKPYSSLRGKTINERPFRVLKIGIDIEREQLYSKINQRVEDMMSQGLLDEVKSLYNYKNLNALNTVGYKEIFNYLEGRSTLEEAVEKIKVNTRRYAKRQITWFSRDQEISWIKYHETDKIRKMISDHL